MGHRRGRRARLSRCRRVVRAVHAARRRRRVRVRLRAELLLSLLLLYEPLSLRTCRIRRPKRQSPCPAAAEVPGHPTTKLLHLLGMATALMGPPLSEFS